MERDLIQQLEAWKNAPKRKPLILSGVRQTGKTYLLEQFGNKYFPQYHIVNFEKQREARSLFDGNLEPQQIINELRFHLKSDIDVHQDLVIFDEIQACPSALTSLKYFCEDMPQLALASAGSLLGLHLNEGSYPVGKVDMMHLYPLTFSEFLKGIGDDFASVYLASININSKITDAAHQQLWERLKQYFVTGGLPEAVTVFRDHQDNLYTATEKVRIKQNELIRAYYADIAKHSGKVNAMHIDRTWRSVPKQLSENHDGNTKRFKFKGVIPKLNRYSQLADVIDWLDKTELIIHLPIVYNVEQPLNAFTKDNIFKLMMFDIGILGALNNLAPSIILDYGYGTYQGYFAENYVAQQLLTQYGNEVYSWQKGRSEIEFLITHNGDATPIEVKSGNITRAQSLQKYIEKYKPKKSVILSARNMRINKNKLCLPLYLAEKIADIL